MGSRRHSSSSSIPYGSVFTDRPEFHLFQLVVLGAVGVAGWLVVIWRPMALSPFVVLAPLPLLGAVVVTAFVSAFPSLSWPAAWQTAAYAGIFWLLPSRPATRSGAAHSRRHRHRREPSMISYVVAVLIEWRRGWRLGLPDHIGADAAIERRWAGPHPDLAGRSRGARDTGRRRGALGPRRA